ncbi:hypothetical protein AX16_001859 [Volvariella volvacea WC 439]|nr:hypothetical protein AX16_001859 [Volvariella volvacea WC 439]
MRLCPQSASLQPQQASIIHSIPPEIWLHILSFLPPRQRVSAHDSNDEFGGVTGLAGFVPSHILKHKEWALLHDDAEKVIGLSPLLTSLGVKVLYHVMEVDVELGTTSPWKQFGAPDNNSTVDPNITDSRDLTKICARTVEECCVLKRHILGGLESLPQCAQELSIRFRRLPSHRVDHTAKCEQPSSPDVPQPWLARILSSTLMKKLIGVSDSTTEELPNVPSSTLAIEKPLRRRSHDFHFHEHLGETLNRFTNVTLLRLDFIQSSLPAPDVLGNRACDLWVFLGPRLRDLSIRASTEVISIITPPLLTTSTMSASQQRKHPLSTDLPLSQLQRFSLTITHARPNGDRDVVQECLLPMFLLFSSTLESFHIASAHFFDLTNLFLSDSHYYPNLKELSIIIDISRLIIHDPKAIPSFISRHAATLETLSVGPYTTVSPTFPSSTLHKPAFPAYDPRVLYWQRRCDSAYDHFISAELPLIKLPKLRHLEINLQSHKFEPSVAIKADLSSFAGTLETLRIWEPFLTEQEFYAQLGPLACRASEGSPGDLDNRQNKGAAKLKSLSLRTDTLSSKMIDELLHWLPALEHLEWQYKYIVENDTLSWWDTEEQTSSSGELKGV